MGQLMVDVVNAEVAGNFLAFLIAELVMVTVMVQ